MLKPTPAMTPGTKAKKNTSFDVQPAIKESTGPTLYKATAAFPKSGSGNTTAKNHSARYDTKLKMFGSNRLERRSVTGLIYGLINAAISSNFSSSMRSICKKKIDRKSFDFEFLVIFRRGEQSCLFGLPIFFLQMTMQLNEKSSLT
jgi:hypothetical protein